MRCEQYNCEDNAELTVIEAFNSKAHYLCPKHAYQLKKSVASVMRFIPSEEYSTERLKTIIETLFKYI